MWAAACETAFWPAGTFLAAYSGNRDAAVESVIDADPVAAAICTMMSRRTVWTQTAAEILGALAHVVGERVANSKTWPANPRALAGRLRRAATFLRKKGIEIEFEREGRARTRIIRITNIANHPVPESRRTGPSTTSAPMLKNSCGPVSAESDPRTVANGTDGPSEANNLGNAPTVRNTTPTTNSETATDGADAISPPQSRPSERRPQPWRARYERERSPPCDSCRGCQH